MKVLIACEESKVYSYEETFQRMQEGRDIFC